MPERLYPKPVRRRNRDRTNLPWRVHYELLYDGGTGWENRYYRTKLGARIAGFWKYHVTSWGGSVVLYDNRKGEN